MTILHDILLVRINRDIKEKQEFVWMLFDSQELEENSSLQSMSLILLLACMVIFYCDIMALLFAREFTCYLRNFVTDNPKIVLGEIDMPFHLKYHTSYTGTHHSPKFRTVIYLIKYSNPPKEVQIIVKKIHPSRT